MTSPENNYQPFQLGRRLQIVPDRSQDDGDTEGRIELVLSRGAFGSGEHETTAACIEFLESVDLGGSTVLDFGCGTGILALATLLFGADRAVAIDIEPKAVATCRTNARLNGLSSRLECVCGDIDAIESARDHVVRVSVPSVTESPDSYDVVIANIFADILIERADRLSSLVKSGGVALFSGVYIDAKWDLLRAYQRTELELVDQRIGEEFWTLLMRRR